MTNGDLYPMLAACSRRGLADTDWVDPGPDWDRAVVKRWNQFYFLMFLQKEIVIKDY